MPKPFIKPVASTVTPKTQRGRVRVLTRSHAETDVSVMAKDDMGSKQLRDPFLTAYDADPNSLTTVLRPPYKMETLKMLPLRNAILLQCIHAMVTNCHSFGHTLVFTGEKGKELSAEAVAEKKRIENFLEFPNDHDSLGDMRVKWGTDYETLGNPYFEVGRNAEKNIEFFYHIPGEKMRLCKVDAEPVLVKMKLPRGDKTIEVTARRYFRRFVQLVGTDKVYFKEFGDPRPIDPKTGKVNQALKLEEQATEILHAPQYWSGSPYGVPCWVNNLPAILGMREADMVNLQYFEDNAIPAMAVLVSGGSLAEETLLELQEKFVNNRGRDQVNRVVVIEAVADMDAAGDTDSAPPVPHLSIQPLRDAQQSDALFLAYDEACMSKIRGSFRLPPIYVGRSDDYTRATAESSAQLAEIQVFAPRRNIFDDMMNTKLLVYNNEPPKFWRFKSNGSKLVDPALILQALAVLETLGAATPNLAIQIANDLFGLDIAPVVEEWGSKPFEFMKQELNLKAIKAGKPQLADGKQDPNAEEGGFPIAKSDLESLTRVTMAIGNFVEQRKKEDAEASARVQLRKSEKLKTSQAEEARLSAARLEKSAEAKLQAATRLAATRLRE